MPSFSEKSKKKIYLWLTKHYPIMMNAAEKDLRGSYASHSKEELQQEIFINEISLRSSFPRIKDKIQQDDIESRIAILKDMLSKL